MKYEWIYEHCQSKKGAVRDFQVDWNATRFLVGGKMFAMQGRDKQENEIITLKGDPMLSYLLRQQYEHIVPGYYMNKEHWNSVDLNGDVPDEVLKEMIDMSYELVAKKLSKKVLMEIQGG